MMSLHQTNKTVNRRINLRLVGKTRRSEVVVSCAAGLYSAVGLEIRSVVRLSWLTCARTWKRVKEARC